jgi:hypothetical protein
MAGAVFAQKRVSALSDNDDIWWVVLCRVVCSPNPVSAFNDLLCNDAQALAL